MKNIEDLDLKLAKYRIDKFILNIDGFGEFEVDPFYISSIIMEKDYDNYNFPYFEFALGVPIHVYRAMKKKNVKIHCYLRMKYAFFPVDTVSDNPDDKEYEPQEKVYMAKNFFVYGVEGTPHQHQELDEAIEKALEIEDTPGDMNHLVTVYLMLYDEKKLSQVTTIVNEVITDCTLTDAVTRVLNYCGFKDVLMTPETNGKTYHEFTLLPIRADSQLQRICNDFHMHTTGTRIFFDFIYNYIVSKNLECDAWRPNEYKKTYVIYDPPTETAKRTQGCCEDGEDKCNYCTMSTFVLSTPDYMEEQSYGLAYTHLDSKTGVISSVMPAVATKTSEAAPSESRVIFNNKGEVSTVDQMKYNIENTTASWEVIIDSLLVDFLTPNKEFELVFLSSKLAKYNAR